MAFLPQLVSPSRFGRLFFGLLGTIDHPGPNFHCVFVVLPALLAMKSWRVPPEPGKWLPGTVLLLHLAETTGSATSLRYLSFVMHADQRRVDPQETVPGYKLPKATIDSTRSSTSRIGPVSLCFCCSLAGQDCVSVALALCFCCTPTVFLLHSHCAFVALQLCFCCTPGI